MYSHSSTYHENLAKIGPAEVEIICLTEIVKNKKQQQNTCAAAGQTKQTLVAYQDI